MSIQDHTLSELLKMTSYDSMKGTYKQGTGTGEKPGGIFNQNPKKEIVVIKKIKPVVKGKTELGDLPPPEPEKDPAKHLRDLIEQVKGERNLVDRKLEAPEPGVEEYKRSPSMIKGLAVDLIDPDFTKSQIIKGSAKVQQLYGEQNQIKPIAKLIAKTKSRPLRVLEKGLLNAPVNFIRHPIVSLQNSFLRDPIENRDMLFSIAVNEIVQKSIFPDNPELALTLPDDFIKDILKQGKKDRNRNIGVRGFHIVSDLLTSLSPFLDSQQRRALDLLQKNIKEDPGFLKDIEERNLKYSSDHAQGFALTLTKGDEPIPDQARLGNTQILNPGEQRDEITDENNVIIQTKIKDLIRPYVKDKSTLDSPHKKQLIKEVVEIYKEVGLITEEDLDSGKKVANNILNLIDDLTKDPADQEHYLAHWPELKIVSYLAQSTGEAQGGQERFFTMNQELTFKMHQDHMKVDKGKGIVASTLKESVKSLPKNIALGTLKTGAYFAGYLASYGIGLAKGVPKSAVGSAIWAGLWPLGPLWSGTIGAMAEGGSDYNTKIYKHESNVTKQLRQASREKTLRRDGSDSDFVRSELDEALVTAVPARDLTESISQLILKDKNDWSSETNESLSADQATEILLNIANVRARLTLSLKSGYKDIGYKTQNWVSYTEGREQEEMTNLKTASLQAFWRLKNLQDTNPAIFATLPLYDANGGDLKKLVDCYSTIIQTGLNEGLPVGQLESNPLSSFTSKRFYKQIFEASGVDESEIAGVENLLISLKNDKKVIGSKTMYEWMDESESLKTRLQIFNKLKVERSIAGGVTTAISSLAIGGAKKGIEYVSDSLTANPQPVAPASPEQLPNQPLATNHEPQIIDLPNIFKEPANGVAQIYKIFDTDSRKTADVRIPLADGYKFFVDGDKNVDIQNASGQTVYEDVFVFDNTHQALVPNPNFVPDSAHPNIEIDLGKHIDFKTEPQLGIDGSGESVELSGGAAIVDYLKEHYREAMTTIAHRDVMEEQHALTTFIDSEGKVHITQGGYTAPNAFTGQPDDLTKGLENGNGALWFTFGKNADGSATPGVPLSFEGIKVPLTWNGHHGEFIFDPRHPTTPQEVLLAKLIDQNALNEFKTQEPNQWLNESDLGKLWMGIRGYEGGYESMTADGVKMHNFEMEFAGENNKLTISPSETITTTPVIEMLPPQPIEIPIAPDSTDFASPELAEAGSTPNSTDLTPLLDTLQRYSSPQLNPTVGEQNIPASSTPLPKTIINSSEFKKEKQPDGYTNQEAKNFLEHIAPGTRHQKINQFIEERVFNNAQREFIRSTEAQEFIRNDVYQAMRASYPRADEKIRGNNTEQLTDVDKAELKRTVLQQGKVRGLTEQEALTVNAYLVNRSYLTALGEALIEKQQLDEQLSALENALANSTRIPPHITNPPPGGHPTPPTESSVPLVDINESKKAVSAKVLINMFQKEDRPEPIEGKSKWVSNNEAILNRVEFEILQKIMGENRYQGETYIKLQEIRDQLVNLIYVGDDDGYLIKNELSRLIREFNSAMIKADKDFKPKVTNVSGLIREHEKEIKNVTVDLKSGDITIPEEENDTPDWLESMSPAESNDDLVDQQWLDDLRKKYQGNPDHPDLVGEPDWLRSTLAKPKNNQDPDQVIATGLRFDDDEKDENGGGELRKSFEDFGKFSEKVEELKQKANERKAQLEQHGEDEFAFFSDEEWKTINDELESVAKQLEASGSTISDFEQSELPIILGGTFDTIIANPNDTSQDVHSYYYHGFRDAFRQYMTDYISRGRDADNGEIRIAFNKLKNDLSKIDSNVFIVRFEDFMDGIRALV